MTVLRLCAWAARAAGGEETAPALVASGLLLCRDGDELGVEA